MSATATRKERERREREELMLDAAYDMVLERGYLGLNMEKLAEAVEYSKGVLYQHFTTKEDLLLALAARNMRERAELFERAAAFPGRARERMCAIGIAEKVFARLYPGHFQIDFLLSANSLWDKTSEKRRDQVAAHQSRCLAILCSIIADAIKDGDLALRDGWTEKDIVFAVRAHTLGVHILAHAPSQLQFIDPDRVYAQSSRAIHAIMDGLQWRPLSCESDYRAIRERICQEIFPEELKLAPAR